MAEIDLTEVARQAMADAEPLAARSGAAITLAAPSPVRLQGDAQALRSAIRNLLDNAAKYGGKHVELTVQACEPGGWLVRVDDDGPGIPPEQRERVFDRFRRGEAREVEGSGLGLAIVRAVAKRHGALLTLGNSPQGGLNVEMRHGPVGRD